MPLLGIIIAYVPAAWCSFSTWSSQKTRNRSYKTAW